MNELLSLDRFTKPIGDKYASIDIMTLQKLRDASRQPEGREEIHEQTGVLPVDIYHFANMADLIRIKGVAYHFSDLLAHSGVNTVLGLRDQKTQDLLKRMERVNNEKNLVKRLPREDEVASWITQSKDLIKNVFGDMPAGYERILGYSEQVAVVKKKHTSSSSLCESGMLTWILCVLAFIGGLLFGAYCGVFSWKIALVLVVFSLLTFFIARLLCVGNWLICFLHKVAKVLAWALLGAAIPFLLFGLLGDKPLLESEDFDQDGISDLIEGEIDSDNDGIPNYQDEDSDNDGILDKDEGAEDVDQDGVKNYLDEDSDGDGFPDADEGGEDEDNDGLIDALDDDSDNDGITDKDEGGEDSDNDGKLDRLDDDSDNDGIPDAEEGSGDIDKDGIINALDDDSDNDGVSDKEEGGSDSDGDGILDYLDDTDDSAPEELEEDLVASDESQVKEGELCEGPNGDGTWYRQCDMSDSLTDFISYAENAACEGIISKQPNVVAYKLERPVRRKDVFTIATNMNKELGGSDVWKSLTTTEEDLITRAETYASLLSSVCLYEANTQEGGWQDELAAFASENNLTNRAPDRFNGDRSILRQELYVIINRVADLAEKTGGCTPKPEECKE